MSFRTARIGDLLEKVQTWNPVKQDHGEFDYIDLSAIDQNEKRITTSNRLSTSEAPSRARQLVRAGDVLVSTVRPNLNGVAKAVYEHDGMTASTGFCVLRPAVKKLDANYLFQWVKSSAFVDDMVRKATGASYPAVSDRIIKDSEIPLPPLVEQKRIAAILDKADQLRQKRRQAIALFDSLTQSIFLEMFGDPTESNGFASATLGDVCSKITDGEHQNPTFTENGMPIVMASQVWERFVDVNNAKFVSITDGTRFRKKCAPENGDILVVGRGATIGRATIINTEIPFCLMGSVILMKPDRHLILPSVLQAWLKNTKIRAQLYKTSSSSAQQAIYLSHIKKIHISIPSMKEQSFFAQRAANLASLIKKSYIGGKRDEALFSSIQHRAFSGQL